MVASADALTVPSLAEMHLLNGEKWAGGEPDVLSMTVAEMDFPVAEPIRVALRQAIDRSDFGYATPASARLRAALSDFAGRRLHWVVDPEQVTVVPDVMLGLLELASSIAGPGGRVGFTTPAYPPFLNEFTQRGLEARSIGLADDGSVDLAGLERELAAGVRVLVLSNPHNPTGRTLPLPELAAIAELCAEHSVWVLADEIHGPIVLPGAEHVPFLEAGPAARRWGIALTSASKAFNLAALKTAFIVTADGAARDTVNGIGAQHEHASVLGEIAAEVAFRDGDPWLDSVLARLADNRSLLAHLLAVRLPAVRWTPPQATYLAWLDLTATGLGPEPARAILEHGRLALGNGLDYGQPGRGHVRLNFATSAEFVTDAVERIENALDAVR